MQNRNNVSNLVAVLRVVAAVTFVSGMAAILGTTARAEDMNTLTPQERADGWELLFDGTTTNGWRGHGRTDFQTNGWEVEDGCLRTFGTGDKMGSRGGDLVTTRKFTDFELSFDWKIAPAGNSGVKYFVIEPEKGHSGLGFEYQLLDDDLNEDARVGDTHKAGALYDLIAANSAKTLKPVGQFNHSRLIVRGNHIEQWLNGVKIVEADIETPEMAALIAKSKYRKIKNFGQKAPTVILLQEHGSDVWFRNIKIHVLSP